MAEDNKQFIRFLQSENVRLQEENRHLAEEMRETRRYMKSLLQVHSAVQKFTPEQDILDLIGDNPTPAADADPAEVDAVAERPGEDQISHLSGIQEQLERIHRVIMFEKSSAWNVVAAVVQCLAIMLLIAAAFCWLEKPIELIVVALTFQVMALTFFVKGK